jgi:hypothetical protein
MVRNMRWAAVAVVLGTASVAAAQSEEPAIDKVDEKVDEKVDQVKASGGAGNFGQADQLVLGSDFDMRLGYRDTDEKFYIRLAPAGDYFFQENLSLGAAVTLGTTIGEGPEVTTLGALVRAGYNMPFQETLSLWPRVGFGIFHQNASTQLAADTTSFQIQLSAPVLFHPASNFFVGAGPNLDVFLGDGSGFDLGVRTVVGGYF